MKKKQKKGKKTDIMFFVGSEKSVAITFISGIPRRMYMDGKYYSVTLTKE